MNASQGGHGTGKTGNLVLTFSLREHREFCSDTGKDLLTQGKYLDCDYKHKKYVYIFEFQKKFSLTSLGIIFNFRVLCTFVPTCYVSQFYLCIYSMSHYIYA